MIPRASAIAASERPALPPRPPSEATYISAPMPPSSTFATRVLAAAGPAASRSAIAAREPARCSCGSSEASGVGPNANGKTSKPASAPSATSRASRSSAPPSAGELGRRTKCESCRRLPVAAAIAAASRAASTIPASRLRQCVA